MLPAAGSQLNISGGISGAGQSLSVDDQGTVVLKGANSYTGGTTVSVGTLIITTSSALPTNTSLTVGAGAAFIFGPSAALALAGTTSPASSKLASAAAADLSSSNVVATADSVPAAAAPAVSLVPSPAAATRTYRVRGSVTGGRYNLAARSVAQDAPSGNRLQPERLAGDPAWLGPAANSSDSSDPHHKTLAIQALDALFAQYGR